MKYFSLLYTPHLISGHLAYITLNHPNQTIKQRQKNFEGIYNRKVDKFEKEGKFQELFH